jgi:hypothetical protein
MDEIQTKEERVPALNGVRGHLLLKAGAEFGWYRVHRSRPNAGRDFLF